jgi:phage minor structural protein
MLIITDVFGNSEALTDFQGVEVIEEVNGDLSLSFTCFLTEKNKHSFHLIQEESIVELDGLEFRIKKMVETRNRKVVSLAKHIFFELIDNPVYGINGGTLTLNDAAAFTLSGSGWTFESEDVLETKLLPNFGEDNSLSLVKKICEEFGCEYKIEPNRHLKFSKEIGTDQDFQFRYKHNIKTLSRTVDTTKFATVLKGFGADGLEVEYRSPKADIYGEKHGEPIRDDRYTNAESLLEKLKETILDVPEVSIELEVIQLGFDAHLGDKVWLIYEPLRIEFETRVMAYKHYPFQKRSPAVVLSNKKETITNLVAKTRSELKEAKKETRSKIDQTNEKITLEVERLDDSISQAKSTFEQTADGIAMTVEGLGTKVKTLRGELDVQAGEIEAKVSSTDFNGDVIVALINMTPGTTKIKNTLIDMEGIVTFKNLLTKGATIIDAGNITTGIMSADRVQGGTLRLLLEQGNFANIYAIQSTYGGEIVLDGGAVSFGDSVVDFTGNQITGLNVVVTFG